MLSPEVRYKLLALLEPNPELSQREISRRLGISLGKVNYSLKALAGMGWIKTASFRNSRNNLAYVYLLTPRGIEAKARFIGAFLKLKVREYETLKQEIKQIRRDAKQLARHH
jgi:EPS-associated MarR family transcriptional regulator